MKRHVDDVLFCVGALLFGVGLWMAWPPLALMFGGAVSITSGLLAGRPTRPTAPAEPEEES